MATPYAMAHATAECKLSGPVALDVWSGTSDMNAMSINPLAEGPVGGKLSEESPDTTRGVNRPVCNGAVLNGPGCCRLLGGESTAVPSLDINRRPLTAVLSSPTAVVGLLTAVES